MDLSQYLTDLNQNSKLKALDDAQATLKAKFLETKGELLRLREDNIHLRSVVEALCEVLVQDLKVDPETLKKRLMAEQDKRQTWFCGHCKRDVAKERAACMYCGNPREQ